MKCLLWAPLIFLAACVAPASSARRDAAGNAYEDCVLAQARVLDDHTSDARTVAAAAVAACYREKHALEETFMQGMDVPGAYAARDRFEAQATDLALPLVLKERKQGDAP